MEGTTIGFGLNHDVDKDTTKDAYKQPEPRQPAGMAGACYLPVEIQMLILEQADWKQHGVLAQVCRFWRYFIQTSSRIRLNRYFPVEAAAVGFNGSAGEAKNPRPRPWLHRSLAYLRQFIPGANPKDLFAPCKVEVVRRAESGNEQSWCRIWPDMKWGFFKDDRVTIYPSATADKELKVAEREIVTLFRCCEVCQPEYYRVATLGPVAKVGSWLSFTLKLVNSEMGLCQNKQSNNQEGGSIVEFCMHRQPILVFNPGGYDTDTLRLWFEGKMLRCKVVL
ncbi:hypothetical protein Dda_6321 [Drechslerella dactyloides]|uniref:F-box domain-containing protein n=1 Tax=Drechslerella dactyloides TaxID=74499 RepID=A0AAD6NID3_DREDA|nr:hypothetical protein Dda_6321 [Drechslerella dactyloides]